MLALALVGLCATSSAAPTNAPVATPAIQLVPSPVRVLRELLAKPTAEREETLAIYPDELRAPLEKKVKEYLAISPELRELRFQATDLRHYLLQLMKLDPPSRTAALSQVPESSRLVVEERLDKWRIFLPPMQEELLKNEQVISYFTQMGIMSEEQRQALLEITPPGLREQMEQRVAGWLALPEATRSRVFAEFNDMFTLTPEEQQRTLGILSSEEREAMNQTLAAFNDMSPQQRAVCLRSFEKFSRMNLLERNEFLRKAQAWERMSPTERQQWRELVSEVPELPPFPPGAEPKLVVPQRAPATNG